MSLSTPASSPRVGDVYHHRSIHPLHAFLLAGMTCFLVAGLVSDWAYFSMHDIQWKNFAGWLIMGGMVLGGFATLWALIAMFRGGADRRPRVIYFLLMLTVWVLSFVNQLIHAKDAWASMPEALLVSAIVAVLAVIATVLGFSTMRTTGVDHEV